MHTVDEALEDRIVGLSAEVAFFAILSLPPLLLTVVAGLGFLPGDQAISFVDALVTGARRVFSASTVADVVEPTVRAVVSDERPDVLSFGFLLALFTASRAVRVVLTSVTIAYDLEANRPGWRQRVYSVLSTLGLLLVVPILVPLLLTGPDIADELPRDTWVPAAVIDAWPLAYWGGLFVGAVLLIAGLYHLAAPWWTPFRRDLPGALLAVLVWVASSAGLRSYTTRAITGDALYEFIAGPLVLLIWLYLLAFGVLLGAELNAELERTWPSPEQQRVPPSERFRQRVLESPAGVAATVRIEERRQALDEQDDDSAPVDT